MVALVAAAIVVGGGAAVAALLVVRAVAPPGSPHADQPPAPRWVVVSTPKLHGRSELRSVACTSPTACVAVGSSASAGLPTALVESWDGRAWSVAQSDSRGVDSWLNGAACPTTDWCVAVGGDSPTGDSDNPLDQTLVEVRAGSRWSVVPSPTPGNGDQSDLQSVACTSKTFCMAVGSFSPVSNPYDPEVKPLTEVWDGTRWTVVPSGIANLGRQTVLRSVVCMTHDSCTAVGSTSSISATGDSIGHALVERWDGSTWTMTATPSPGRKSSLESVSCPSANSCVAVGSFSAQTSGDRTLVERWDGSAWSIVSSPGHGSDPSSLQSVSCTSASTCLAVGSYSSGAALENHQGLVETWTGQTWSISAAAALNGELASVVCIAQESCTAVGRAVTTGSTSADWQTVVQALR